MTSRFLEGIYAIATVVSSGDEKSHYHLLEADEGGEFSYVGEE